MRKSLVLAAVLVLTGCNNVHSIRPLVAGPGGAPALKPGLWVGVDKDCVFDPARPLAQWPGCAAAMRVDPAQIQAVNEKTVQDLVSYRLGGRAPTVVQVRIEKMGTGAPADDAVLAKLGQYQYLGLEVRKSDPQGMAIEAAHWTALCGPPPPKAKKGEPSRFVTEKPLPGLTVVDDACTTQSLDAVRRSVIASRAWSPPGVIRWVREKP